MITRILSDIKKEIPRVTKERWITFVYDLGNAPSARLHNANDIHIRLATEKDIEAIAKHSESNEPIVGSILRFWREYGFRKLYLGMIGNDPEPAIMQYVLDDTDNDRYASMEYGNIYRKQSAESVVIENIYAFKSRRRKNIAVEFEIQLFNLLKQRGKREVWSHIGVQNKAALLWARMVGLRPVSWTTSVSFDLPLLRALKRRFVHAPIHEAECGGYPLSIFKP